MDIAYSTEFKQVIDAEKAYDLFQSEVIKDKRAFECPNENCTAQFTCVNIDRPIQETKKSVHFRSNGIHIDNCHYGTKKTINSTTSNNTSDNNKNANIHILTERPKDYYTIKETSNINTNSNEEKNSIKREYQLNSNSKSPKKHYWIAPLVSTYLNAENNKTFLSKTYVKKGDLEIPFKNFFIEIKEQDFKGLSKYPRIYFGKAFFNTTNTDNVIEIKFATSFNLKGQNKKPAIRLNLNAVSEYKNYSYWKKRLEVAIQSNRPYLFFIYGVPNIETWDKKNEQIHYIRFKTKKLDYMDLRI
jgi:hypothetical protein